MRGKFVFTLFFISILLIAASGFRFIDDEAALRKKATDDFKASITDTQFNSADELHWTGKTSSCKPGKVPGAVYSKLLKRINYFRRLAGVHDDLFLDSTWNKYAQAAALIMYANNMLVHDPHSTMKCYSDDGKTGASSSNLSLFLDKGISELIIDEIQDGGVSNKDCGHRRWLLNSKGHKLGIGITNASYAIRVFAPYDEPQTDTTTYHGPIPEYFAYPFKGYVPYEVIYPKWSFAVPAKDVSFATATISVTVDGKAIPCSIISRATASFGDPTMVWTMTKLKEDYDYNYYDMPTKRQAFSDLGLLEKKVTIKIAGVKVGKDVKEYTYSFTIFDPEK